MDEAMQEAVRAAVREEMSRMQITKESRNFHVAGRRRRRSRFFSTDFSTGWFFTDRSGFRTGFRTGFRSGRSFEFTDFFGRFGTTGLGRLFRTDLFRSFGTTSRGRFFNTDIFRRFGRTEFGRFITTDFFRRGRRFRRFRS